MGNEVIWGKSSVKLETFFKVKKIFEPIKYLRISSTLQGLILETNLIICDFSKRSDGYFSFAGVQLRTFWKVAQSFQNRWSPFLANE